MSVIPLTLTISLCLVFTFVLFFIREQARHPFSSSERESLLPLADETPRTVTFSMDEHMTVEEAMKMVTELSSHNRVPVYDSEPDNVTGIIMRKIDIISGVITVDEKPTENPPKRRAPVTRMISCTMLPSTSPYARQSTPWDLKTTR